MKKVIKYGIILLVTLCYVFLNLKMSAIYYAKHMPHKEGSYPELRVLIDNLWWISELEDGTFKYKIDGDSSIDKIVEKEQIKIFSNSGYDEKKYYYHDIENNRLYVFDKQFNLIRARELGNYKTTLDLSKVDEKKIKEELYAFLKPVVDYQRKPLINLQWLFNWLHQDELN